MTNQNEGDLAGVLDAGAAASQLGVSPSGMRRLAVIYEELHGELPRKPNTKSRMYPSDVVETLMAARVFVEREEYLTIREALEAYERGERPSFRHGVAVDTQETGEALGVLVAELQAMREGFAEVKALRAEVVELRRELRERPQIASELQEGDMRPKSPEPPREQVQGARGGLLERVGRRVDDLLGRFRSKT